MNSYAKEKLSLAAGELTGPPDRKKLEHVVIRTLIMVTASDLPEHLQPKWQEIRSVLLRHGKLGDETVSAMSAEEVRQVWRGLQELCRETIGK